jgi:hypothetical protein
MELIMTTEYTEAHGEIKYEKPVALQVEVAALSLTCAA